MPLVKPLARTRSVATDDSLTIADSKSRRGLNPAAFYVLSDEAVTTNVTAASWRWCCC